MLARKTETDSFYKKQLHVSHVMPNLQEGPNNWDLFIACISQSLKSLSKLNNSQKCVTI